MTNATARLPYPVTYLTRSNSASASPAAERLRKFIGESFSDLRKANTWNRAREAYVALREAYEDCSAPNWDGYGAEPLHAAAYEEAIAFLNALPTRIPVPEIAPEPDGSIGFEWRNGPHRIFAISVSGKGSIVYAGILGKGSKAHGTELFDGTLPEVVLTAVRRIFS